MGFPPGLCRGSERGPYRACTGDGCNGMRPQSMPGGGTALPDDIKQIVWMGVAAVAAVPSAGEPQFDHIIPIAMGRGSGPENLQILWRPPAGGGTTPRLGAYVAGLSQIS
jgi:hypothetical protein